LNDTPPAERGDDGAKDVAHAARSGAMQTLTIAVQGLLSVTHVLLARLFGQTVFGLYQTCLAMLEIVTRAGSGGAPQGMLRYVAAHRARGEADMVRIGPAAPGIAAMAVPMVRTATAVSTIKLFMVFPLFL